MPSLVGSGFLFYKLHNSRKDVAMMNAKIQTLLTPDQQLTVWRRHFVAMVFYQGVRQQDIQVIGADWKYRLNRFFVKFGATT